MTKINAAVVGATGYTGYELVKILTHHPNVDIKYLSSRSNVGVKYTDIYQQLKHVLSDIQCIEDDIDKIASEVDIIFLALPHGISASKINKDIKKAFITITGIKGNDKKISTLKEYIN